MAVKGGIERLGPEKSRADFRHKKKRYRQTFHGPNAYREAKIWKQAIQRPEILDALGMLTQAPDPGPLLEDVMQGYVRRLEAKGKAPALVRTVRASFARVHAFMASARPLAFAMQITGGDIADYWDHRLRTMEGRRATRGSAVLHDLRYLRAAYRRAGLEPPWKTPRDYVETIPEASRKVLSDEQMRRLLQAMDPDSPERAFAEFLARTGCRPIDARRLTWDKVDPVGGSMTLYTSKKRKTIHFDLSPKLMAALSRWKRSPQNVQDMGGHVFTLRGAPLGQDTLRKRLEAACKAAGIPIIGWGTIRHTALGTASDEGEALRDIQAAAGHASLTTTEGYLRKFPGRHRANLNRIDRRY